MGATMSTQYRVLKANGEKSSHETDIPIPAAFEELRPVIEPHLGGGLMQRVSVIDPMPGDGHVDMFVDEMADAKGLAPNPEATIIYRAAHLKLFPEANPSELPMIRGTAVLFPYRVVRD